MGYTECLFFHLRRALNADGMQLVMTDMISSSLFLHPSSTQRRTPLSGAASEAYGTAPKIFQKNKCNH